ncbi:hypothetical protein BU23DRAFT_58102 [Bimuria novae-zelandiae CBS 107.79]|uniref:Uncharacterized protein n=1 Tax=Bimuria novae-zelandiae CBS 107.79 TaxID=1447943 RepID=A0A6A5VJS9_9PLEO|nr:hypothetical protein BU23DRAFT_58102 [Bimuria novae-zelandiae CBS 107.79]
MAIELYPLGLSMDMTDHMNDAMAFIFSQYRPEGVIPDKDRLTRTQSLGCHLKEGLHSFMYDVFLKRCTKPLRWSACVDFDKDYLFEFLRGACEHSTAGRLIQDPLRLSQYHIKSPLHDKTCSCKDLDAGDEFIIK